VASNRLIFSIVAELPPPSEPFDPLADSEMKKAIEIINIAESIVDEVVNKLLNEDAEKVLKEE
jgi:Cu2+-containing amine oxidase